MFGLQINVQVLGEIRLIILVSIIGLISYAHQIVRLLLFELKISYNSRPKGSWLGLLFDFENFGFGRMEF